MATKTKVKLPQLRAACVAVSDYSTSKHMKAKKSRKLRFLEIDYVYENHTTEHIDVAYDSSRK